MSEYDAIRLETQDGDVVAYFAPAFQVTPMDKNDLMVNVLPRGRGTRVRDINKWQNEITVQGQFEHSSNLPDDHQSALESVFGSLPVTPRQQVNRIRYFARTTDEAMILYENEDEYSATNMDEVDLQDGVFPTVFIQEFRPPRHGGHQRMEYMVKLVVGFDL